MEMIKNFVEVVINLAEMVINFVEVFKNFAEMVINLSPDFVTHKIRIL